MTPARALLRYGETNAEKEAKMATVSRFFQPPKGHFFLFGPRGTGKSTWLKRPHSDALWVDLLAPDVHRKKADADRLLGSGPRSRREPVNCAFQTLGSRGEDFEILKRQEVEALFPPIMGRGHLAAERLQRGPVAPRNEESQG